MTTAVPIAMQTFLETYGSTRIAALRQIYGNAFAPDVDGLETLASAADRLPAHELKKVVMDHVSIVQGLEPMLSR